MLVDQGDDLVRTREARQWYRYRVVDFAVAVGCRPEAICSLERTPDLDHEDHVWNPDHSKDAGLSARNLQSVHNEAVIRYLIRSDWILEAGFENASEAAFWLVLGDYLLR